MKKKNWLNLISCVIFLFIVGGIFSRLTYLFSNSGYNRFHITGIKEESPLDMVYIGGSAAYVYWQPMKAWHDKGMTSYSYSTDGISAESIKHYMVEVLKTQNPKLFVVDVRPFQYWSSEPNEVSIRVGADAMNISASRMKFVYEALNNRDIPKEAETLSSYLRIIKYHSYYASVLSNPTNWSLINNKGSSQYKGWEFGDLQVFSHVFLQEPKSFVTDQKANLPEGSLNALYDLLNYAEKKNLNILFVVCPYFISMEDKEKYNALQEIIEQYGFQFLDANEHYDEIDIDFSTDFYNGAHVNCLGAEKYTNFLQNYIEEHYQLPDHRGEKLYSDWEETFSEFSEKEKTVKSDLKKIIQTKLEGIEIADAMSNAQDGDTWSLLAGNENFVVLFASQGQWKNTAFQYSQYLKEWGIYSAAENGENFIKVIHKKQHTLLEEVSNDVLEKSCLVGEPSAYPGQSNAVLSSGATASIVIGEKEYALQMDGINAVVYDYNRNIVVDSVVINCDTEGKIVIKRK